MYTNNTRVQLKDIVASQLPEFIRAQYPTFVSFVEAYYEWLGNNSVDLTQIRDIDTTLDEFIKYFKAELAQNYPVSSSYETERYLLKHVRDQYLAKGSEASYKLLFRLLFSKDVYMDYPGKQMLRVSDGRWQQDISLFVRVDVGDPFELIGKIVDIQTSRKIYRSTPVEGYEFSGSITKLTANIENVLQVSGNVYELFLNRNFYGEIIAGDVVKYGSDFQGQILPCASKLKIANKGKGFKPGMVFQVASGDGSPIWFKVLTTEPYTKPNGEKVDGGLKTIDLIKFGLGYSTDFSLTILPSSAVSTQKKVSQTSVAITYSVKNNTIAGVNLLSGGSGYIEVPDVIIGGALGSGATAHAVLTDGVVTQIIIDTPGEGYENPSVVIVPQDGDPGSGAEGEIVLGSIYNYSYSDQTNGFTENGYLSAGDYWDLTSRGNGGLLTITLFATTPIIKTRGTGYVVGDVVSIYGIAYEVMSVNGFGGITSLQVSSTPTFTTITEYNENGVFVTGGTGTGAKISPTYGIDDIVVANGGANYNYNLPVLDLDVPTDGDGIPTGSTSAKAKLSIANGQISDVTLLGSVDQTSVLTGGSGYNKNPIAYFKTADGDNSGKGAKGIAQITNGVVTGITLVNSGNSYQDLPEIVIGDEFTASTLILTDDQFFNDGKVYTALNDGITGETAPTHTVNTVNAGFFLTNFPYTIATLGTTDWNQVAGTEDVEYEVGDQIIAVGAGSGTGTATTTVVLNGQVKFRYSGVQATAQVDSLKYGGEGYIHFPSYRIQGAGGYSDGAYVGTVDRQFFIDAKDTISADAALINVTLGAVARYPGYYKTNDGFLDDSMFIQDSYYYQAFAYVLKIDEQLESYASVVRTMLHPSGMAMFGEYSINNKINLNVAITSLVKSLGISLFDIVDVNDTYKTDAQGNVVTGMYYSFSKDLSTTYEDIQDAITSKFFVKGASEEFVQLNEVQFYKTFTKAIGFTGQAETVFMVDPASGITRVFSKTLEHTTSLQETYLRKYFFKTSQDFQTVSDYHQLLYTLNTIDDGIFNWDTESGYVVLNPYDEGSYQAEHYSNERNATFST